MTFFQSRSNSQIKLSPKEILEISQEISREYALGVLTSSPAPVSKIKLSAREMFEISEEIRQDFAPRASNNTKELVLLPVDPDHIYAYWKLGDDKLDATQKNDLGKQLTLRIYSEPNKNTEITKTKSWFDVAIDSHQAQQKVFLPMRAHETKMILSMRAHETAYHATIGKRYPDNSLAPFAHSNITHVPFGKAIPDQFKENQIAFKAMPQSTIANQEISHYTYNTASGLGINQQAQ